MYRFEKWSGARDPFRDAIASLGMMSVLEIAVESMIVDRRARDIVRSTVRNSVIPIDDVFAI